MMGFKLYTKDFLIYFERAKQFIAEQKDYVTELDATTGDGDHWVNVNMGFEKITAIAKDMEGLSLSDMFKKVGMTMFSSVGGSSGALYGSGYLAASKASAGKDFLDVYSLYIVYNAFLEEIMKRGKTGPNQKTMIDSLFYALQAYKDSLDKGEAEKTVIQNFIYGANEGAQKTKEMKAVKGRASYRTDRGVGHLDPGAVTMAMQLQSLGNYILQELDTVSEE